MLGEWVAIISEKFVGSLRTFDMSSWHFYHDFVKNKAFIITNSVLQMFTPALILLGLVIAISTIVFVLWFWVIHRWLHKESSSRLTWLSWISPFREFLFEQFSDNFFDVIIVVIINIEIIVISLSVIIVLTNRKLKPFENQEKCEQVIFGTAINWLLGK